MAAAAADTIWREEAAMEVHPGIFVSNIAPDEWEPDPEVGGEMHVLAEREDAFAGLSRFLDVDVVGPWTLPVRETILILEGAARIEIAGGPTWICGSARWPRSPRAPSRPGT
jgi:hypothetical protein